MSRPFVRKPYVHLGEGIMLDNDTPGKYAPLRGNGATREFCGDSERTFDTPRVAKENPPRLKSAGREDIEEDDDDYQPSIDATMDAADATPARRARWWQARRRLANLRTALQEAIARRREKAAALAPSAYASLASPSGALALSATALAAPNTPDTEWAAEVAEWAHVPAAADVNAEEIAPFDDVEGELFVRLAETEGGATQAAAAAASEWERASASMSDDETEISRIGAASEGAAEEPAVISTESAADAEKAVARSPRGSHDRPGACGSYGP